MKKTLSLLLCVVCFKAYAVIPQHLNVIHDYSQRIYLTYAHLQDVNSGAQQLAINPVTCTFTTQYSGKIYVGLSYNHNYKVITVTANKPYKKVFSGFFIQPSVLVANLSCNSGWDSDKCVTATQQMNDASVVVNCS